MCPSQFRPAALVLLLSLGPAWVALGNPAIEAGVGWGGRYRPDRWTPAFVRVQADAPVAAVLEWYVPRPGREAMVIRQSVTLNPQGGTHLAYLPIGPDPVAVHLRISDGRTGRIIGYWPPTPLSPLAYTDAQVRQPVFVGVSGEGPALRWLDEQSFAVAYLAPQHLPRRAIGYDGLDVVALNRPNLAGLNREVQEAIAAWVRAGGHLLLWLDAQSIPEDTPLGRLLPATVADFTVKRIAGEETGYTRLAGTSEEALVTRRQVGLGLVTFLHVAPEVARHAGADFLQPNPRPDPPEAPSLSADQVAQAKSAAGAGRPPMLGPLLVIALLVGPVDWLVLRQTGRRSRRWITLPGWLAVFALLIWALPRSQPDRLYVRAESLGFNEATLLARGSAATSGARLDPSTDEELATLHRVGPIYWRTVGFDRTRGPLRDLVFSQGPDGMMPAAGGPGGVAFHAEGTALPH